MTDITYIWALGDWLYLAAVIALFSRQIVGRAIDSHMRTSLMYQSITNSLFE